MGACLADTHHICQTMSAFEVVLGVYIVIAVFHAIVATFATLACIVYVLSTIAERSRIHWKHVGIAVAMVGLSAVFYVALFSQVRFPNLFDSERWPPSTFQFRGAWSLWFYFESFCIIFAAWFKVGCSVDAWRRMPAESEGTNGGGNDATFVPLKRDRASGEVQGPVRVHQGAPRLCRHDVPARH